MQPRHEPRGFDFDAFGRALGWTRWPYSPQDTYWDGRCRFLDRHKGGRLLGLPHSDLLLSEYDAAQGRNRLHPFPWPKTVEEALTALVTVGWWEDTPENRGAFLARYEALGGR